MLLYLNHSPPDMAFATHQCARYTFGPKQTHKDALIRIGQYLKGTIGKGLIMTPSAELKLDCYPDADFAGLWNRDDKHDPHCVRSHIGYYAYRIVLYYGSANCKQKLRFQLWKLNMSC